MRIADYPKTMKRREQYTTGDIARLFGVSNRTAAKMIDQGSLQAHTVPGGKERRVLHSTLEEYVSAHPQYKYVFNKLQD